ncbi:MAG: MMPL family transporter, partial [Solirubrobacterales bacterium]
MQAKSNIAARAARWSATHRKLAIFGWLAFVVASVVIGGAVGTKSLTDAEAVSGESGRAELALEQARLTPNDEMVLIQSDHLRDGDPAFDAAVEEATRKLAAVPSVRQLSSPVAAGGQVSADGHAALVEFQVPGSEEQAEERVDASLAATAAVQSRNPDVRVEQFGGASAGKALEEVFSDDLAKAETTSLPITLLILLLAFGALVAALVPLLIAFSAVIATVSLLALPSQLVPMDPNVASVVVLVGLAVGVDYSLFYMRREREERRAGRSAGAALQAAAATSGRAVLVSGFTVIAAMSGMLLSGDPTFTSFAVGTMTVVAVAMFASLSVLPAVLSKLGDRVELGRVPFLGRLRERRAGRSLWAGVVERVMRRPVVSMVLSAGLLVALAIPALSMNTVVSGAEDLPRDIPVVQTYDRITAAFPGEAAGATVVVEAEDVGSGPVAAGIDELVRSAEADPRVSGDVEVETSRDGSVAAVQIPTVGSGSDAAATRAMEGIRDELVPAAFAAVEGAEVNVGGQAAQSKDFGDLIAERLPLVFAFVLGLAFLLLLVTFRSIVVPVKAIVLNLLSVGAAYGVLVLVFQDGLGESLLGFHSN